MAWGLDRLVSLARADGTNELQIRIGVSQVLILIAFMFSFVLAMTAAFVGAPAIGGELESGVALAILARPLRRAEVLLGRWLGSAVVVVAYTAASGLLAIAVAARISGYGPPDPFLAVAFLSGQALVLLTLTLALGSVLPVDRGRARSPWSASGWAGWPASWPAWPRRSASSCSARSPRSAAGSSRATGCGAASSTASSRRWS